MKDEKTKKAAAARQAAKEAKAATTAESKRLLFEAGSVAVYSQRSTNPASGKLGFCYGTGEIVKSFICHKVTVVGITVKEGSKYTLKIGYSKCNPMDKYSKRDGFNQAIKNILIEKDFIEVKGLLTKFNKDLFLQIADLIIQDKETIEEVKKA